MHLSSVATLGERQIHSHDVINLGVSSAETQLTVSSIPSKILSKHGELWSATSEQIVVTDLKVVPL